MEVVILLLSVLVMINIEVEATTMHDSLSRYQPNVVDSKIKESYPKDGHHIPLTGIYTKTENKYLPPKHIRDFYLHKDGKQNDTVKVPKRLNETREFLLPTKNTEVVVSDEMKSNGRDGEQGQTIQLYDEYETYVFSLPSTIKEHSHISVKGDFTSNGRLTIILGYDTFAVVQIDVFYPINGQTENKIVIEPPPTDNVPIKATDYFFEDYGFSFQFKAYVIESQALSIFIEESHFTVLQLHKSLKDVNFLSCTGILKDVRFIEPLPV